MTFAIAVQELPRASGRNIRSTQVPNGCVHCRRNQEGRPEREGLAAGLPLHARAGPSQLSRPLGPGPGAQVPWNDRSGAWNALVNSLVPELVPVSPPSSRQPTSCRGTLERMHAQKLVGREREFAELTTAVRAARAGRGSLWFLCGEPGIGKSRLSEELADAAALEGALVVWGRCWEVGGAPAYWPWIQVLRALLRDDSPARLGGRLGRRARYLAQLVPEFEAELGQTGELTGLDQERERFELLDAISGTLCGLCNVPCTLVILEDLHAADASSLSVFEVLGPELKSSRLCVIGTYRDADSRLAETRDVLARAAEQGRTLPLGRLARADVAAFLAASAGSRAAEQATDSIFAATEGNPLFLTEVTRLLAQRASWDQATGAGMTIPGNLRHTLRRRMEALAPGTRALLEVASVIGRDFSGTLLSALSGRSMAQVAPPLTEALDAGVVTETLPGEYRFSHVLVRETLHRDLDDARRTALHLEAAELLHRRRPDELLWSEIAHHYLEAGAEGRTGAVDACRRAAEAAAAKLGFSEAAEWYARALTALGQDSSADLEGRAELLVRLADAELHRGAIEAGKKHAERAADLARALGNRALFCRSALTYGSILVFAAIDQKLVELLREALSLLDPSDSPERAVLGARLAAALQPAEDPDEPIAMAREAVLMARRLGNPRVWLETARYAVSAMMDLARPSERVELNREYIHTAESLDEPLEALRGKMRLVFDCFELGDVRAAELTIEEVEVAATRIGHPFYTWRAHSFRAMNAMFQGRFAEAEAAMERASSLGHLARDPNVLKANLVQRSLLLKLQGRYEALLAVRSELLRGQEALNLNEIMTRLYSCEALVLAGYGTQAARLFSGEDVRRVLACSDTAMLARLLTISEALNDPETVVAIQRRLELKESRFCSMGMTGMVWEEPIALLLARCLARAGRFEEARRRFEEAIEIAEQAKGRPFAAWARVELAGVLAERSGASPTEVVELLDAAEATALELDMPGLAARASSTRATLSRGDGLDTPVPTSEASSTALVQTGTVIALELDGELWTLTWKRRTLRLRDSKGVQWLAELLNRPGAELHALDLFLPGQARVASDAGELLDAEAISAYRRRLRDLDAELAEAESFNDPGRIAKASAEREFLRQELGRSLGLGNRVRRAGDQAERARINVQRRLRDAIRRIAQQDAELGAYLDRSVITGTFCSYRPIPDGTFVPPVGTPFD